MSPECRCEGEGFYRDTRCVSDVCDHRKRPVIARNEEGKATGWGERMSCPRRPCSCAKGSRYRTSLEIRIEIQRNRLSERAVTN